MPRKKPIITRPATTTRVGAASPTAAASAMPPTQGMDGGGGAAAGGSFGNWGWLNEVSDQQVSEARKQLGNQQVSAMGLYEFLVRDGQTHQQALDACRYVLRLGQIHGSQQLATAGR